MLLRSVWLLLNILVALIVTAQQLSKFEQELQKHNYSIALVVPSSEIDEYPLFSPNQKFLSFNVGGRWREMSLSKLQLTSATWLNKEIGFPDRVINNWFIPDKLQARYLKHTKTNPNRLVLSDSTVVEIKMEGLGSSLYITQSGDSARKIWTTGMEPCFNLAVGVNQNLIAFICPMSGMLIMDVRRTLAEHKQKEKDF